MYKLYEVVENVLLGNYDSQDDAYEIRDMEQARATAAGFDFTQKRYAVRMDAFVPFVDAPRKNKKAKK
jgi:hypothetical protein